MRRFLKAILIAVLSLALVSLIFRLSGTPGIPYPRSMFFNGDYRTFITCFQDHAGFGAIDPNPSYKERIVRPSNRIQLYESHGFVRLVSWRALYVDPTENGYRIVDTYFDNQQTSESPETSGSLVRKFDWVIATGCGFKLIR